MPKRTRNAKKRRKPDALYEAFRAEWERKRKAPDRGGSEWLAEKPGLPVDPMPFVQTLSLLSSFTQDRRFIELRWHLMQSGLIDFATQKWSLTGTKRSRVLFELLEEAIAEGTTERQAVAEAVAVFELFLDAQSFDAAFKRLQRQLHDWRKFVGQKPR